MTGGAPRPTSSRIDEAQQADHPLIHDAAIVEEGARIGRGTRVWAFAHVLGGTVIGEDCNICDHTFFENDVVIGDRVTIKTGVQIPDGTTLEDDVFVGPCVMFTNDPQPRSRDHAHEPEETTIRRGASIGAGAVLLPGIEVGAEAFIAAGSVVTRDVPAHAIVMGNPARISGYVSSPSVTPHADAPAGGEGELGRPIPSVSLVPLHSVTDLRGSISVGEVSDQIPFVPQRYFVVYAVPTKEVRGEHAHIECHEFLTCVAGSCSVVVDDGEHRAEVVLDSPEVGLHIPPMVWAVEYKYSPDAVLLVLATHPYDPDDYIRDYDEFLQALER